jgi:benzoyl-CoA reductase/2-hydroxyglutaryl-CoA dehydratase subunit BcrC/BadD/HgdB
MLKSSQINSTWAVLNPRPPNLRQIKKAREDAVAQTREEAQKQAEIAADKAKKEREGLEKKLKDASDEAEKVREGLESKFMDAEEKLEEAVARAEAAEAKHNAFVSGMKWTPPSPERIGGKGADGEEGTVRGHAVNQRDLDMCRGHVNAAFADVQADLERMVARHAKPRVVGKGTPQKVAQKVAPR